MKTLEQCAPCVQGLFRCQWTLERKLAEVREEIGVGPHFRGLRRRVRRGEPRPCTLEGLREATNAEGQLALAPHRRDPFWVIQSVLATTDGEPSTTIAFWYINLQMLLRMFQRSDVFFNQ
jgi:hypothetical protein